MILTVLLIITAIALGFAAVGALRGDKIFLLPAAGLFFIVAGMLLLEPGIEYAVGDSTIVTNNTKGDEVHNKTIVYTMVDEKYDTVNISQMWALIYIAFALYLAYIGIWGKGRGERGAALRRRR